MESHSWALQLPFPHKEHLGLEPAGLAVYHLSLPILQRQSAYSGPLVLHTLVLILAPVFFFQTS